jgi:hypothetical protein
MTSINQLLIDRDSQNFLINYNKNGKESIFQKQGNKYNKLQKKNANYAKNDILREGYQSLYDPNSLENITKTAKQSQSVLTTQGLSTTDQDTLKSLQDHYKQIMQDISVLEKNINDSVTNYSQATNKNTLANHNVIFTPNKESAYVTNAGYAKVFNNQGELTSTGGNNNCPAASKLHSLNTNISGISSGNIINSNPLLLMGTPMVPGQSCGYEGENVFVDTMLPKNAAPSFVGCYGGNSTQPPLMTVLGGSPGNTTTNIVKNGDFSQPALQPGTYKTYTNNNIQIVGWSSNGAGLSNGSSDFGFPSPYPGSGQALVVMGTSSISQIVSLTPGLFTMSFISVGSSTAGANLLNISLTQLNQDNSTASPSTSTQNVVQYTPSVTTWQQYPSSSTSTGFTIKNPGNYVLTIQGTSKNVQNVTAIQDLVITDNNSGSVTQNYSFQDCEQAAIHGGYQYFSLNNINNSTGYGHCSVSNVGAVNTNYYPENPVVVSSITALWSSGTSNTKVNYLCVLATIAQGGQLQLLDSTGIPRVSFGGGIDNNTGFIGCYNDKGLPDVQRSMTHALNSSGNVIDVTKQGGYSRNYDYNSCSAAAEKNDFQYFGIQWNNGNNPQAQCFLSNDLGSTTKYGKSSNCWKVGDNTVGGGWANAVYSTQEPSNSPCYLLVQDDGNICIYKGTDPGDNQGLIWETATNGKAKSADHQHAATLGKNGRSYLKFGESLQMGEFIGNTNGTVYLIMQQDGNLVAYASTTTSACSKSSLNNDKMVAAAGDYAIYNISQKGYPNNIGKLAHIDNNGTLMEYPDNMITHNVNNFSIIHNADSQGGDMGTPLVGVSLKKVKAFAAETARCVGFVYDKPSKTGYLKSKIANVKALTLSHTRDVYISTPSVVSFPPGVNSKIHKIDSVLYENYPKGPTMSANYENYLSKMTKVQESQLGQLYDSLNLVVSQMDAFVAQLKARGINVNNQIVKNNNFVNEGALKLEEINKKIKKVSTRDLEVYNQILNDNELLSTAQNYTYMIWTIFALGVVIVTVNATR